MKKKYLIVTGGAGFIGTNLIKKLLFNTDFHIISIDNYSAGTDKNHIDDKRIKYIKGSTKNIEKILSKYKSKVHSIFHFGEFSRIFQSFKKFEECYESNLIGSLEVFKFCLQHKIKLIYSATSASLGNNGANKNLSPYAFSKAQNLELLENFKSWFNFKFEIIYFYNVYGTSQIEKGEMATVIGIFEKQFRNKKALTVVKPGTQSRRFTHVNDTVSTCIEAWKLNKCKHYSVFNSKSYSIIEVAKLFKSKIRFLPKRKGERYASHLTKMNLNNHVNRRIGKIQLKDYIEDFLKKQNI